MCMSFPQHADVLNVSANTHLTYTLTFVSETQNRLPPAKDSWVLY